MFRVAIIGGGPRGLMTAHLLERRFGTSCRMTLLERSHDAHGYGVLGWLLAGADALSLCNADDRVLIARALESLPVPSTANHATIHRPLEPGVGVG